MQVTIDIPEPLYRRLETEATAAKTTLETLVVRGASHIPSQQLSAEAKERASASLLRMNLNDFALMTSEEVDDFEQRFERDPEEAVCALGLRRLDDPPE